VGGYRNLEVGERNDLPAVSEFSGEEGDALPGLVIELSPR
jgi:hypothetical protein